MIETEAAHEAIGSYKSPRSVWCTWATDAKAVHSRRCLSLGKRQVVVSCCLTVFSNDPKRPDDLHFVKDCKTYAMLLESKTNNVV